MSSLLGKVTIPINFCLPFQWDQLLKERICSSGSKSFSVRLHFGKLYHEGKQTVSHKSCFPFAKMVRKQKRDGSKTVKAQYVLNLMFAI